MVQIEVGIVRIERAPAAILALHSDDPFDRPVQSFPEFGIAGPVERHGHDRRIVDIRIMIVRIFEGPATRPQARPAARPVTGHIENLAIGHPLHRLVHGIAFARLSGFHHRLHGQSGVPHRGQAGLAIAPLVIEDQKLANGRLRGQQVGMILRVTQPVEGHDGVRHGRKNTAQPIVAVQPRLNEIGCPLDAALSPVLGKLAFDHAKDLVESDQQVAPRRARRIVHIGTDFVRRRHEQLVDMNAARIARPGFQRHQDQQRGNNRARPIRHFR